MPSILDDRESRWPQRKLKKSSNVHESHPVVGCTKDIVTNAAARRGVDEINFGGSYFCDDAYVSHNTPTGAVSFETDDIARSCVGDGYMHSGIVKEGRACWGSDAQCGVVAIAHKAAAIETTGCFSATAVMGAQV